MFGYPKDTIEYSDTPRPQGIATVESVRGGVFGQDARPYGRTGMFKADWMMPMSVAAQDYGAVAPDNVSPLPGSVMNPTVGLGCANCTQCRGMGSCKGMGELGQGVSFALGAALAIGGLYLLWYWAKDNRLMK